MVEFALVVTFVFLLFVSILQTILFMYAYNTLADAAKEGVRYAIVHGTGYCGNTPGVGGTISCACSGPGTVAAANPTVSCTDTNGTFVVNAILGGGNGTQPCFPTCGWAGLSFQSISSTNSGCVVTPSPNTINVCYDPGNVNTNNPNFLAPCSQPGCLVRVTVSHTYNPLFGLGWPSFTMSAASDGRIMN
jgi:hypothetical protein